MFIKIPNALKQFLQPNNSNVNGNIWSSFCLDLTSNIGRMRVGDRMLFTTSQEDQSDMRLPVAFLTYKTGNTDNIWMMAGSFIWKNAGNDDDPFVKDATSNTPSVDVDGDMELFNNAFYVKAANGDVVKYDGTWTTVTTATNGSECSFCQYAARLYGTQSQSQIFSIDLNDAVSESSGNPNGVPYTLDLTDYGVGGNTANKIISIRAAKDRIWILTGDQTDQDRSAGRTSKVFEWDGVSTQPIQEYALDSVSGMALIIKDDIPHVMDAEGRLNRFNGGSFIEIARLPLKPYQYLYNPLGSVEERWMHPRGIAIKNGRIQILIKNDIQGDGSINENLPSGIWEHDEKIGLYHKHALSRYKVNGSGAGMYLDYGQNRIYRAGAIFYAKQTDDSDNNGDLMAGAALYVDGTSGTDKFFGVFVNDTLGSTLKTGYFVTPQIESQQIQDMWQRAVAKYKKFLDAADKIVLKMRTDELTPVETLATWVSTTVFTSTDDLSRFTVGDEVEGIQGNGGGQTIHIANIVEASGTYTITLEDPVLAIGQPTKVRLQNWQKIDVATDNNYKIFTLGIPDTLIQLKCVMYFKGDDELQELQLLSDTHEPTQ